MGLTVKDFREAKGRRLVYITAYDFPTARLAEEAGVDAILVGDSLGMVVLGYPSTVPVTLEEVLHHTKAVRRGAPKTFVVADLPYLSYATLDRALFAAERLLKEGGADAVKLEGGREVLPVVEGLVRAGVPVLGHLGLTPQTASLLGGYKLQGRTREEARRILEDALALEAAGVYGVVLEMVPTPLARLITERLRVHTVGIGAGPHTDGQVLVFHDLVGLSGFKPRFVRQYARVGGEILRALKAYAQDVRSGSFPGPEESFSMPKEALEGLE